MVTESTGARSGAVGHHGRVDAEQVAALRALLAPTGWLERTRAFARTLRRSTTSPGGLLLVGTPDEEPWHLAAHLDEESRFSGIPELTPTLVRWGPAAAPAGRPAAPGGGSARRGPVRGRPRGRAGAVAGTGQRRAQGRRGDPGPGPGRPGPGGSRPRVADRTGGGRPHHVRRGAAPGQRGGRRAARQRSAGRRAACAAGSPNCSTRSAARHRSEAS